MTALTLYQIEEQLAALLDTEPLVQDEAEQEAILGKATVPAKGKA